MQAEVELISGCLGSWESGHSPCAARRAQDATTQPAGCLALFPYHPALPGSAAPTSVTTQTTWLQGTCLGVVLSGHFEHILLPYINYWI